MRNTLKLAICAFLWIWPINVASAEENNLAPEAQKVVESQLLAFRARDNEAAFSHASPSIRSMMGGSSERFIGMVRGDYEAIYSAKSFAFGRNKLDGRTAYQEVLLTGPNGKDWKALYTLTKQPDGTWKISGVRLLKDSGSST